MRKIITLLLIIALAFYRLSIHNEKIIYRNNLRPNKIQVKPKIDQREENLRIFFNNYKFINSPLASMCKDILQISDKYNLDYRLVLSIAGVESTFCKSGNYIPETHNCFGYGPHITFNSFGDSYETVAKTLATRYDASSIESIGKKYNPSNWKDWSNKVNYFVRKIEDKPYERRSGSSSKE